MDIEGVPLLGTPKQNGFIIKLAGALGFVNLMTAVNTALARPLNTVIPNPFNMADASKVISALLEKCAAAGISTFSPKGKGKRGKRKEKAATVPAAPLPPEQQPPLPVTPPNGRTVQEALAALADDAKMLFRRGCTDAEISKACGLDPVATPDISRAGYTTRQLAQELAQRADWEPEIKTQSTEALCGELERRGLPAGFLITDPDAVAVAPRALEWIDWNLLDVGRKGDQHGQQQQGAAILRDAGREVKE